MASTATRQDRRPRRRRIWPLLLLLALLAAPAALAYLALEWQSAVQPNRNPDPAIAASAKALVKQTLIKLRSGEELIRWSAREAELNALGDLAHRGVPRLTTRVNVTRWGLEGAVSVALRGPGRGPFLNLRFGVDPARGALAINHLELGRLPIPAQAALGTLRLALNLVLGNRLGDVLIDSVSELSIDGDRVEVALRAVPDLQARLDRARDSLKVIRDELALLGDPAVIRRYYQRLVELAEQAPAGPGVSLSYYLNDLIALAASRSAAGEAHSENRSALLALAIYFGDGRLESLIGRVRVGALREHEPRRRGVVLAGREDLRLHFVLSAAIQILSDTGMSQAVGEFKELLDTRKRGSGFSFVDLAADRAGVHFAQSATDPRGGAWHLQDALLRSRGEDAYFPVVGDLPERLDEAAFAREFGALDSPRYRQLVAEIDARLDRLPAYRYGAAR